MRLAIATWNGRVSPVFDVARQALMLDIEDKRVVSRHEELLPGTDPQSQVDRLKAYGTQTLICGAISRQMADFLTNAGIRVVSFTAGNIEDVLAAWIVGALPKPALSMPGCAGRMRRCRGGSGGRRGCPAGLGHRISVNERRT